MDESSSVVSSVGVVSTVTIPSVNNVGKSWKVFAENGVSHKSRRDPGGGGFKFSNHIDEVDEHVLSESWLSVDMEESLSDSCVVIKSGGSKSELSVEITLMPSGDEVSVICSVVRSSRSF